MNRIAAITAALAATLAGCTIPLDESPVGIQDHAAYDTSGTSFAPHLDVGGLSVQGAVRTIDGDGVGGATVCVLGQDMCTTSAPDGTWEVDVEAGVSELVRIDADGFFTAILPIERSGERNAAAVAIAQAGGIEIELVPRARLRLEDMGAIYAPDGPVRPVAGDTFDHQFEPLPAGASQVCTVSVGWSGPDPDAATLALVPGAITYVQRDCVAI